jgi:hypothetical protein
MRPSRSSALLAFALALLLPATLALTLNGHQSAGAAAEKTSSGSLFSAGDQKLYGHVKSLKRVSGHYELRFDPALLLTGVTANAAAAQDAGLPCKPAACPPVPNDSYVVDESHRLYTYLIKPGTPVHVLYVHGNPLELGSRSITVAQLAALVNSGKARGVKLFEPLLSGVWIRVHIDTVLSLDQQFRP